MFESLTERLTGVFGRLGRRGRLSERDVDAALREVRMALLDADVALPVTRGFIRAVQKKATGQAVTRSVTPGQQVIKIVHDELINVLAGEDGTADQLKIDSPPAPILMVGLQGSGKTTTTAKIARRLQDANGKRVLVASLDTNRPAAMEQLEILGRRAGVDTLPIMTGQTAQDIARRARQQATLGGYDIYMLDTAGRLHIDHELIRQAAEIRDIANPRETLLVVDGLTGQDAVNVAENFDRDIGVTGIVLTRMDGDGRGGAALSMRAVTGKPIKFVGVGEKLDALEAFHPERMASRLLGMGDVLTLIEKAEQSIDPEAAAALESKIRQASFTLEDFQDQLRQVKQMGPLENLMELIPGLKGAKLPVAGEKDLKKVEAIIGSMTLVERRNPTLINGNRRKRIALGSGTRVEDVNRLLKQFGQMRKLMKSMMSGKGKGRRKWAGMPPMVRPF